MAESQPKKSYRRANEEVVEDESDDDYVPYVSLKQRRKEKLTRIQQLVKGTGMKDSSNDDSMLAVSNSFSRYPGI